MKRISPSKWNSLPALLAGIAMIVLPGFAPGNDCRPGAAHGHGHGHGNRPHPLGFGGWLVRYFDWEMGDGPDSTCGVRFLPLPEGEEAGGSFTYDDPGILEGEETVTLKRGESFTVPIVSWIGEMYEDGSEDEPLSTATMNESEFLVTIDGHTVARKAAGASSPLYSPARRFEDPILYDEPTDYGSVGAVWVQGFSLVHQALSPGRHVMRLHSTLLIKDLDLGLQFENTWIINVKR